MHNIANGWVWLGFAIFLGIALSIDTIFLNKSIARSNASIRAALMWTLIWVAVALVFNLFLWVYLNLVYDRPTANEVGLNFLTGYLIEKSLSVDNLFVFYLIFKQFHIPVQYQQRVFSYGIWGAIIMRLGIILVGTWLVSQFHWILYLMGAFLLLTGIKMIFMQEKDKPLSDSWLFKGIQRCFRVTSDFKGEDFFIKQGLRYVATPLFVALVFIEFSDLVFAMDSIPAIFAITRDPFIVWSSNIFAILGLRALYFILAGAVSKLRLLKYGVALILVFVGVKMVIEPWILIPVEVSLGVITGILLLFILLSLKYWQPKQ